MNRARRILQLCAAITFCLLVIVPAAHGHCPSSFAAPASYPICPLIPIWMGVGVAIGDLNGDGWLDLAVYDQWTIGVRVMLNNRDGTFQAAGGVYTGVDFPYFVAIGDLNGDGRFDLVTSGIQVAVSLGNGDGTFQTVSSYPMGHSKSVAIGDVNNDGLQDLVVADRVWNSVRVLLGNGDGTFQAPVNYSAGSSPVSVAIADFNGDGPLDLAVVNQGSNISVLLGIGDGTFATPVHYVAGATPYWVAIGDLNGDGRPDLAVANLGPEPNYLDAGLSVLLGIGDGTFQAAVDYPPPGGGYFVAISDINGDSRPDLLAPGVWARLGNGDGTFQQAVSYGGGSRPFAIGDLNGDSRPDLVTAFDGIPCGGVSVLLNDGPSIGFSQQPAGQSVLPGQTAVLSVAATGTGPLSYRWRRNGATLLNGGHFSGVNTSTLTVSNITAAEVGAYDVRVTGGCNGTIGATSQLAILTLALCRGDFNTDNQFDALDIQGIVEAMLAGETCP